MLNQVDELAGRLHPQLAGVDVDGGQRWVGQLHHDGVVEGDDGQVLRQLQPYFMA